MQNLLLYLATSLIWGSTWLAIQYQIGTVTPSWSVTYRFAISATILLIYCWLKKCDMRFNKRQHAWIALQGFLLFSINYILYYIGSAYFISGVVAVIFASISMMNIFNNKLCFKAPILPRVLGGSLIGLVGLIVIFWSEIMSLDLSGNGLTHVLAGLSISLIATYFASLGNMVSSYNQKQQIPILQTNALGMAYGTLFALAIALISGAKPDFMWTISYTSSLLYLAVFGSILAFGCYLSLLGRIGADRAAYAFVFIPIIAMLFSTAFEGFKWSSGTFAGVALVLLGNLLVLRKKTIPITPPTTTLLTENQGLRN